MVYTSHHIHYTGMGRICCIGKDIILEDNSVELSLAIHSMLHGSLDYVITETMQVMVSESCDPLVEITWSQCNYIEGRHHNNKDTYIWLPQHSNCMHNYPCNQDPTTVLVELKIMICHNPFYDPFDYMTYLSMIG